MPLRKDIVWGLRAGLFFAFVFLLFAAAIYLLGGSEDFNEKNISLPEVATTYFIGGTLGGLLLGVLRPFTKWRIGAALVGIVVIAPATLALALILFGSPTIWPEGTLLGLVLTALILGGGIGYLYWEP